MEWDRVEYSTILAGFPELIRDVGDGLDDADEIHLGGEYAFFVSTAVLAIRLGAWHDPDHQIHNHNNKHATRLSLVLELPQ